MDFLSKLLHRNPSGGGGSPQKPLSSKASDTLGQIKSETNLTNKNRQDVVLSTNRHPTVQLSEHDGCKKTGVFVSKNLHHDEEEDEIFEDAEENKLSLTLLAADLDKIHLSTPKSMSMSRTEKHEFVDTKDYRADLSSISLCESYVDSDISFGHSTSLNRSLSPEYTEIIDTESNNETISIVGDCNETLHLSSNSSDNLATNVITSTKIVEETSTLCDQVGFASCTPNQHVERQLDLGGSQAEYLESIVQSHNIQSEDQHGSMILVPSDNEAVICDQAECLDFNVQSHNIQFEKQHESIKVDPSDNDSVICRQVECLESSVHSHNIQAEQQIKPKKVVPSNSQTVISDQAECLESSVQSHNIQVQQQHESMNVVPSENQAVISDKAELMESSVQSHNIQAEQQHKSLKVLSSDNEAVICDQAECLQSNVQSYNSQSKVQQKSIKVVTSDNGIVICDQAECKESNIQTNNIKTEQQHESLKVVLSDNQAVVFDQAECPESNVESFNIQTNQQHEYIEVVPSENQAVISDQAECLESIVLSQNIQSEKQQESMKVVCSVNEAVISDQGKWLETSVQSHNIQAEQLHKTMKVVPSDNEISDQTECLEYNVQSHNIQSEDQNESMKVVPSDNEAVISDQAECLESNVQSHHIQSEEQKEFMKLVPSDNEAVISDQVECLESNVQSHHIQSEEQKESMKVVPSDNEADISDQVECLESNVQSHNIQSEEQKESLKVVPSDNDALISDQAESLESNLQSHHIQYEEQKESMKVVPSDNGALISVQTECLDFNVQSHNIQSEEEKESIKVVPSDNGALISDQTECLDFNVQSHNIESEEQKESMKVVPSDNEAVISDQVECLESNVQSHHIQSQEQKDSLKVVPSDNEAVQCEEQKEFMKVVPLDNEAVISDQVECLESNVQSHHIQIEEQKESMKVVPSDNEDDICNQAECFESSVKSPNIPVEHQHEPNKGVPSDNQAVISNQAECLESSAQSHNIQAEQQHKSLKVILSCNDTVVSNQTECLDFNVESYKIQIKEKHEVVSSDVYNQINLYKNDVSIESPMSLDLNGTSLSTTKHLVEVSETEPTCTEQQLRDQTMNINDITKQSVVEGLKPSDHMLKPMDLCRLTYDIAEHPATASEETKLYNSELTANVSDVTKPTNDKQLFPDTSDQTIKSNHMSDPSLNKVSLGASDEATNSTELTKVSSSEYLGNKYDHIMESKKFSTSSKYEQLDDIVKQAADRDEVIKSSNAEELLDTCVRLKFNDLTEPSKIEGLYTASDCHILECKDLIKSSIAEKLNHVSDQINNSNGLAESSISEHSNYTLNEAKKSSDITEESNIIHYRNSPDTTNKQITLIKHSNSDSESVKNDKCRNKSEISKVSPKTTKCVKSKTLSKRSLNKSFQIENPKSKPNSVENTMCEFFITSEKKTDAKIPIDFDERLAEEAANLSDHLLNLSQQMQDSDSENDSNKTVISMNSKDTKSSYSSPQKSSVSGSSQCKELQRSLEMANDYLCHEAYMQSMHSVLPVHLNQSEAGPITADELSTQDLEFQDGASLDLDYFNQVGSKEEQLRPTLIRDSLYVKFDPIVNAIVSKTVGDTFKMPPPPLQDQERTSENQNESESIESKAEELEDSPKTPGKSPALEAVQKLISLTPPPASSASVSPAKSERTSLGTPTSIPPKSAFISPEQLKKELTKLENIMREREKYFEIELDKRLSELEKKDSELKARTTKQAEMEAELKVVAEREHRLKKEVVERTKSKQQLGLVMEEYEKTISQLVAQKEEDKKEFEVQKDLLMKERDTAMQHLNNMEIAFNDVHQKYERSKTVIEGMKVNEDSLKKSLTEYDDAIKTSNAKYESLKNHAIKQLETANQELDIIRRSHQAEIAKLKAMLKKAEVRVTSLEESLEQKSKENQELAAICDELISKVGSGGN